MKFGSSLHINGKFFKIRLHVNIFFTLKKNTQENLFQWMHLLFMNNKIKEKYQVTLWNNN